VDLLLVEQQRSGEVRKVEAHDYPMHILLDRNERIRGIQLRTHPFGEGACRYDIRREVRAHELVHVPPTTILEVADQTDDLGARQRMRD
jgi:hypothetical protein